MKHYSDSMIGDDCGVEQTGRIAFLRRSGFHLDDRVDNSPPGIVRMVRRINHWRDRYVGRANTVLR